MGNDTKTEPGASPKVGFQGILSDEVKAEVASLVQAALSQMKQPGYDCSVAKTVLPVVEISTGEVEAEMERKYKEIVSNLEAKVSETNKQLESAYRDLSDARDQLEKQRAKSVHLEQRILQMSEAEGTFKSTLSLLRAEKDKALAREREALLSRDRAGMHNMQLSNQLSELQNSLDLKTAELSDAAYIRQQLENRVSELTKGSASLQPATPSQGAPTGATTQSGSTSGAATSPQLVQPPSSLYFAVPMAGARRHTVPNIYPAAVPSTAAPAAPTALNSLALNRPPKRVRVDSGASDGSESTHSHVSSGSATFVLRPVKPESTEPKQMISTPTVPSSNAGYPRYQAYPPTSPITPISPQFTRQHQNIHTAPISYQNQGPYQTQASVSHGPSSVPPAMGAPSSATRPLMPTMAPTPVQMTQPAPIQRNPSVQQFINQLFLSTPAGFPECKICKVHPLGQPNANGVSGPPSIPDLLAHAEKYHGRRMSKPAQQQQA